ncbi:hypothetical protein GCM10022396_02290 [Flavivirga amylovorans]
MHGQTNLYVSPTGNDSNSGTINSPLRTLKGARDKIRSIGVSSGGVTVNFRAGRYPVTTVTTFGSQDSGTSGSPVVYTGYQNEKVIFDGTILIDNSAFELVPSGDNGILHATAPGNVYVQTLTDQTVINVIKKSQTAQMSMDDKMMTPSRYPNIGFSAINDNTINNSTESAPPSGQQSAKGTASNPLGAKFKMDNAFSFNASKWNAELNRTGSAFIRGYVSADWFKGTLAINSVSNSGEIHLRDGSRYGIKNRPGPNRFFVSHLLCELDEPGEWYFDESNNKLYIWPLSTITNESTIGVWAGPQMVEVNGGSYIHFEKMTIQGLGAGVNGDAALNFKSGDNFFVGGVTFRYISAPILALNFLHDVSNSTAKSCDFFDIPNCTRLYGGSFSSDGTIVTGNNRIENCHFTQIYSKDFNGKAAGIQGVRNIFKNNLVHNENIQPITYGGIDHIIERNEVFNVGIEEGDGGAIYSGGDIMSYGNMLRHNFIHHIMSIPTLLGRASIFSDDFDGGDQMRENVTYKGGWEVLKMNGGAGHTVQFNVIMDGNRGIRQGKGGSSRYNSSIEYINSTNGKSPTSSNKENYIGRMLQKIGVSGWQSGLNETNWYSRIEQFWKDRYPFFNYSMKAYSDNNQMNGYQCRYYDNMFWSNDKDVELGGDTNAAVQRSQAINLSIFENPNDMNFKFKEPRPSYAPNIPFESIGLYSDSYRCAVPNKNDYRRMVKQHFEGLASYTSDPYNPATINDRLYYNTGQLLYSMTPCAGVFNETSFFFDFGTTTSTVFSGYQRVSNETTGGLYGWTNTNGVNATDRGTSGGVNHLNRDLVYGSSPRTFEVKVPNGSYEVLITFGDATSVHNNIIVKAEGVTKLTNVNTTTGNTFFNRIFEVAVNDGLLSVEFSDGGGSDPNWVLTRMIIKPIETQTQSPLLFDLGTPTSAVFTGYNRVSQSTTGAYGWTNASNLDSRDRGTSGGVNNLNRDFVFSSQPRTFEADVLNGEYNVLITFGDATNSHDDIIVKAEGITKLTNIDTTPGNTFFNRNFDVTVNDGKLSIEFSDGGGTDINWVATRIIITPKPSTSKVADTKAINAESIVEENTIDEEGFKLYPNPAGHVFNVEVPLSTDLKTNASLVFYDLVGNVVLSQSLTNHNTQVVLDNLSSGVYVVVLSTNNKVIRTRLVKK